MVIEDDLRMRQEFLASNAQFNEMIAPVKELPPENLLQALDAQRHGGLRARKPLGGAGKVPLGRHRYERPQQSHIEIDHY
ncbi:hypothetical protein [Rhizobium sp. R339]|uniref:hypothetical protein n=1 Tax=Rhizobium sp. R339 TaxID=1764273 RepID=UPI001FD8AE54|nr:hypothetical protein [Rhizobium sp. R339]